MSIDMIGKTISHYRILEKIGQGGIGVVHKAEDTKLKRIIALKFLTTQALGGEEEKTRFFHEAQAAAALDHPNICTVYEIDETDEQTFIAMAYIDGMNLKEKIESGPLKLDDALDIAIQVAEGLQEAHEKDIIHRDIKSANIMVTEKSQVKIMDFGLAKLAGSTLVTKEGTTMGTVAYMSPEQARGEGVDHRTDIWSLGVVLYEMVTGQLPFKGEYEQAVIYSILNEEPEAMTGLRTGVPMEFERIVNKCLEKEPSDRYQHADELIVDLRRGQKESKFEEEKTAEKASFGERFRRQITVKKIFVFAISSWLIINSMLFIITNLRIGNLFGFTMRPVKESMRMGVLDFESRAGEVDFILLQAVKSELYKYLQRYRKLKLIGDFELNQIDVKNLSRKKISTELDADFLVTGYLTGTDHNYLVDSELYLWDGDHIATHYSQIFPVLSLQETSRLIADSLSIHFMDVLGLSMQQPVTPTPATVDTGFTLFSFLSRPIIDIKGKTKERVEISHSDEVYRTLVQGKQLLNKKTLEDNLNAIVLFETALLDDGTNGDIISSLAEAYYQRGQLQSGVIELFSEAEDLLTKAIAADNISTDALATAHFLMSKILIDRDNLIKARTFIRRAKKLNRSDPRIQQQFKEITRLYLQKLGG